MKFNDGWVDTASEYNIMQNSMPRQGYVPTHLVFHGTAGGSNGNDIIAYMATADVSTHLVISVDGTIWQGVSCDVAAWGNAPLNAPRLTFDNANANPNYWTISIEFAKPDTTNEINITDAQFTSGAALAWLICQTYNIPARAGDGHGGIIGHCDLNSVDRAMCPGTFPWDEFWAYFAAQQKHTGLENSGVFTTTSLDFKNYWSVQGEHWQCKNGFNIGGAMRQYYCDLSIDGQTLPIPGLPLSNEIKIGTSGETVQHYEKMSFCYNPTLKAFPPGSEYNVYVLKANDPLTQAK